jgi:hypothetical protein
LSRISLIHLPLQIALRGKFGQKKTENIPEAKEKKRKRKHVPTRCIFHYKVFISLNRQTLIVSFKLAVDLTYFRKKNYF